MPILRITTSLSTHEPMTLPRSICTQYNWQFHEGFLGLRLHALSKYSIIIIISSFWKTSNKTKPLNSGIHEDKGQWTCGEWTGDEFHRQRNHHQLAFVLFVLSPDWYSQYYPPPGPCHSIPFSSMSIGVRVTSFVQWPFNEANRWRPYSLALVWYFMGTEGERERRRVGRHNSSEIQFQ